MTRCFYGPNGLHILMASGHYIGQVRRIGCQKWRTVTAKRTKAEVALSNAVMSMGRNDKRARVLFIDSNPYYEPNVIMEAMRT